MKILNTQKDHNLIAQNYRKGMDSRGVKGCLQEETQLEAAIKGRNQPGGGIGRTLRVMHAREAYDPEWEMPAPTILGSQCAGLF